MDLLVWRMLLVFLIRNSAQFWINVRWEFSNSKQGTHFLVSWNKGGSRWFQFRQTQLVLRQFGLDPVSKALSYMACVVIEALCKLDRSHFAVACFSKIPLSEGSTLFIFSAAYPLVLFSFAHPSLPPATSFCLLPQLFPSVVPALCICPLGSWHFLYATGTYCELHKKSEENCF